MANNGFYGNQNGYNNQNGGFQPNNGNGGGRNWNLCENWSLKVFGVKQTPKALILNTGFSGEKHEDGTYAQGMFVSVLINNKTNCPNVQFVKGMDISVDGFLSIGDYFSQQNGTVNKQIKLLASAVRIRQRNNGGYNNQPNGYQQNGYQNSYQNGYQNGGYQNGYNQPNGNGFYGNQNGYQNGNGNYR